MSAVNAENVPAETVIEEIVLEEIVLEEIVLEVQSATLADALDTCPATVANAILADVLEEEEVALATTVETRAISAVIARKSVVEAVVIAEISAATTVRALAISAEIALNAVTRRHEKHHKSWLSEEPLQINDPSC